MVVVKTTARRIVPVHGPAKTASDVNNSDRKKTQVMNVRHPRPVKRLLASPTPVSVGKRNRVQTTLYQAPASSTPQVAHLKKAKKPVPKKLKDKNNNRKVVKKVDAGKMKKGAKKESKSKKGNDRLVPRDISVNKENGFLSDSSIPEFVSINTYHRWLIRALLRNNLTELKAVMKSNKISSNDFYKSFSYSDDRTAETIVMLTKDSKLVEVFYKLKEALDEKKLIHPEPNMLQRKSTGQRNFYMLGRATRAIEMSRGGREGNNAFLNYETPSSRYDRNALDQLIEEGTDYKELLKMSQLKHCPFQMNQLETCVVTAVRQGHCEIAYAIASAEAQYCCNDLHRITLKVGGKLPQKILGASVVKKCFGNKYITPLHTAAINPDGAKMLEQLRAVDPNINVPDQDNWYTIHYAAVNRSPGALHYLLRIGTPPSMLNKKHHSPLHVAAMTGRAENLKVLLEAISKLEKGDDGEGPLPVKSLINARAREGDTALLLAVKNGHKEAVKTLLDNETVLPDAPSSTTTNKVTPLMLACSLGFLEIAKLLVAKGALIEAKDKKKRTALTYSVLNGQHHTAAYLLSMGASLLKGDSSGNSPAHYASAYGWLNCLQLLAEVDSSCLSLENDWKITPLTVAFLKGHYGIVSWLLDGEYKDHVNINAKDSEGYTLLSCLLAFSDPDVHDQLPEQIDYLLDKGANCSLTDSYNNTILHDFASLKIKLRKSGEKDKKGMTEQQYRHCYDKLFKKAPSTVNSKNQYLQTPFHLALDNGNLRIFNYMLETADVKELFSEKWTSNGNFLHALFKFPITIWNGEDWSDRACPPKELYDILPILKRLQKQIPTEISTWLREKNTEEQEPILTLVHSLNSTGHKGHHDETSKPFMNYMCEIIEWACDIHPETPTLLLEETESRGTISLIVYSFNIPLEDGSLQILKTVVQKAVGSGQLLKLLFQEINKVPLPFVALASNISALRYLLQVSKDHNLTNGFHNAVLEGQKEGNIWKELKKSLLIKIIENTHFDLVGELSMSPDDWKAKDAYGNSAWHHAAKSNHHRTLSLLKMLESKGVPREKNDKGATPLHVAVQSCDGSANSVLEPVEWLVNKSNVAEQDDFGRTAMHYAFASFVQLFNGELCLDQKDPIAIVSVLAMNINEAELNVTDINGNTALHFAAAAGANICAVTMLRKGADVNAKNNDGNTPLALAVLKGRQGVSLTLIQANSSVTEKVIEVRQEKKKEVQWKWNSLKEEETIVPNSTIPAQIVKRGLDWAAMVYVLLDTLGKNTTSMAQITACALREKQYNLANQLLKSLEALLDGKPLVTEEDLIVIFAESCQNGGVNVPVKEPIPALANNIFGRKARKQQQLHVLPPPFKNETLEVESVERTVLDRLLNIGCPILKNGTSPALEIALSNQSWHLAEFLKEKMGKQAWSQLTPVHVDEGPLKALLMTGRAGGEDFSKWIENIIGLKQMNAFNCSMTFSVPRHLTGLIDGKFTAMGVAALHGSDALIFFLRKKGFDVNSADDHGRTPLMMAILANEEKAIAELCNDNTSKAVAVKKDKNVVKMKMSLGNHLAFTLNGRKRKASESDEDEDEESESEQETEEEDEEEETNGQPSVKKLKITNKSLKLDLKDKKGRNILHYLVEPAAWENVELLNLLAKENKSLVKKLLQEKDSDGNTPVMLAANNKQRKMAKAMSTISGKSIEIAPAVLPSVDDLLCPYDFSADSSAFITKFAAFNDQKKPKEVENRPHKLTGYKDSGLVVYDDNTSQYFKVLLNKSDLSYGRYGFHNFYRMELVKRRDTELYNVFTNWGRIGSGEGEYQNTPFGSLEAAVKEFCSIFKSKTGQDWLPLQDFKDIPKKYRLIKVDKSPYSLAELELPKLKKEDEMDEIRAFIRDISDPEKLKEFQNAIRKNLTCSSPFGRVTKGAIQQAREILKDCELVAKQIQEALNDTSPNQDKIIRLLNQSNDLSSEFYSVIPIGNAEYSALKRYDDEGSIQQALAQLNRLSEVEIAARILTAASERQDIERVSYIQSAIECGLRAMTPDEAMSQYILQWIHNTKNQEHQVKGIIEITPKRAVEKFEKFANDEKQMFLLHGTRAVNLISLLRDGFLVDPQNTQINGRLFGDGIYLADCFGKSHDYCQESARRWKYMLVCQVSFGKLALREKDVYKEENLKSYDSFHMRGTFYPKSSLTIDGVAMPLGLAKETGNNHWRNNYSEFIIRDPNRVLPRFIIMYQ